MTGEEKVTSMADFIERKAAPDKEFVRHDEYGRRLYCFMLDYVHDGREFSIDLWAYDISDASEKAASISKGVKVVGQIYKSVDA